MSDPRNPKPLEGRTKFADRNKTTVGGLEGRQPKTSLKFMVPDDTVTFNDSKLGTKVYIHSHRYI
jgi:hypothetical protein